MTAVPWTSDIEPPQWRRIFRSAEDGFLAAVLATMLALPVIESIIRLVLGRGVPGSSAIVQHCTLVVSMLGAAVATRDDRMLVLATATFFKGIGKQFARLIGGAVAAAVSVFLAVSGFQLVSAERVAASPFVYGIPLWTVQLVLPVGFALIAIRLVLRSAESGRARALAAALAVVLIALPLLADDASRGVMLLGWLAILAAAISGAPLFALLGGATLVLNWQASIPIAAAAVSHYSLVVNPSLPAIPLFTLAGYILAEGGASQRLVRVFRASVGTIRGGPALVTTLACAFFTSFTGGSGVTILALGGLLLPILMEADYSEKNSIGLLTAAGSLGLLLPPCLPMILYAIAAQVDMRELFVGAFIPGCLLLAATVWVGARQQRRRVVERPFSLSETLSAIWTAKWELLLPFVVMTVLLRGWATPVEAAAATALYALAVETLIHRGLRSGEVLMKVFRETTLLVGGILIILGVALAFTAFLIDAQVPEAAATWMEAHVESKLVFLLLLNIALLGVGAMMDIYSAIVVIVPLIIPLGRVYGIDPVHLGVIFLANLELGYLVPPVGENLFIASYRFGKPLAAVARAVVPMLIVFAAVVLVITYVPSLTTWLPGVVFGR